MESVTAAGLIIESRSIDGDAETVGPDASSGDVAVLSPLRLPVQPWAGWPVEWQTPLWRHVTALTDTAWTCLDRNSAALGSMPPYLVGAAPSLDADWITNPNPLVYSSWDEFARSLFWDLQGAGEAFVLADAYYRTGWPARFHVVPPWAVDADFGGDGLRRYRLGGQDVTGSMLHIRYRSTVDDARGHGPLEVGGPRLVAAAALTRYAADFAASGGVPTSVLVHPARLTAEQATTLQMQWVESRMSSLGLPAVLSGGVDFKTLSLSPTDAALVELAGWNDSRIAVLLGVPPFLVGLPSGGDPMTYSNVVSLFDYHWRAALRPLASLAMGALSGWALPRGTTVELNRDEYVKPDPLIRAQTWQILNSIVDADGRSVLTVDEIRELERYGSAAPAPPLTSGVLQ